MSQALIQCSDEQDNDSEANSRGYHGSVGAGIAPFREAVTALNPSHQAPHEPSGQRSHDEAAQDVARVVDTQIHAAIALQQRPCDEREQHQPLACDEGQQRGYGHEVGGMA